MNQPPLSKARLVRRLVFALVFLVALDPFVEPLLLRLEAGRYDGTGVFRFEDSDLFALGPLVSYLREHPRAPRRRVLFCGNSVIFGFKLTADEAIPAQYEKLMPDTRVLNASFNSAGTDASYLVVRDVIDSVDGLFVMLHGKGVPRNLASLVPVEESDLREFHLTPPDVVERRLESMLGFWHLYSKNDRLQAALFGTSTRQYLYLHKRDIVRGLLSPLVPRPQERAASPPPSQERVVLRAPRSAAASPERLLAFRREYSSVFRMAELAINHRKRIVFLCPNRTRLDVSEQHVADFNAAFAPYAEVVLVTVPDTLTLDRLHFTAEGSRQIAEALVRHEREERGTNR